MTEPASTGREAAASSGSRVSPSRAILIGLLLLVALAVPAAYAWSELNRPAQVTGTVIAIRAKPPLGVDSFDLLAQDGRTLTFKVGALDISPGGFDAPHLLTHQASGQAVVVSYRTEGVTLIAVRLEDGPPVGSAPTPAASSSP